MGNKDTEQAIRVRQASKEIIAIFKALNQTERTAIGLQMIGTSLAVQAINEGIPVESLIRSTQMQLETTTKRFHEKAISGLL